MASWYIDTGTQRIWKLPIRSPITDFRFERGSAEPIAVRFVTDGTVVELGGSATVTLGFKQTPTSASYIIPSVTATKTGTGTSAVYTVLPTFLSTDLDTYLSTADSKSVYMQLKWVDGTTTAQTPLYIARVSNNVNRGGELIPPLAATPTIVRGLGSGSTSTVSITGTDAAGQITIAALGGDEEAGVIATVTFAGAYSVSPYVTITPANDHAATLVADLGFTPYVTSTTTTFVLNAPITGMQDGVTYKFNYIAVL